MKVKDIIKISATLLGKDNVVTALAMPLDFADNTTLREINAFTTLLNSMLIELASTYVPMLKTEEVGGVTEIVFKNLSENAIRIVEALDKDKNSISYTQKPDALKTKTPCYYLVYEYIPAQYDLEDSVGYTQNDITETIIAYGLSAEYCISEARYLEAVAFHEKYLEGIKSRSKIQNGKTVARKWA